MDLNNKVALITGSARGVGKALAVGLLDRGAKVCLCDINKEVLEKSAAELKKKYGDSRVTYAPTDVSSIESLEAAFKTCQTNLGDLDIVVNNAAMMDEVNYLKLIEVNFIAVIRGTELALKTLKRGSVVLNTASITGIAPSPFFPRYAACKAGVIHYSRNMGNEFHFKETGVRVLCFCPNKIRTTMTDELIFKNNFDEKSLTAIKEIVGEGPSLEPEEAAAAMIKMIDEAESASVAVCEKGIGYYYVNIPPEVGDAVMQQHKPEHLTKQYK